MFPGAPCLDVGTPQKANYVPIEFLIVAKGQRRAKLDGRQTDAMIKVAAVSSPSQLPISISPCACPSSP